MGDAVQERPAGRRVLTYQKRCEKCGKLYWPVREAQRYCSRDCSHWARMLPTQRCVWCDRDYQPSRRQQRFCSHSCAQRAREIKLGEDWQAAHMAKMRSAAVQAHMRAAIERAATQLPPDITPVEAYRLGVKRGRNMGYQSGVRLARKVAAEAARRKEQSR